MHPQRIEQQRPYSPAPSPLTAPGAVLAGALVGSALRAVIGEALPAPPGALPIATLFVNIAGSLALGIYLARSGASTSRRSLHFWAIGVLGSFTTFSAFSAEVFRLVHDGAPAAAAAYVLASLLGGVAAAVVGWRLGGAAR